MGQSICLHDWLSVSQKTKKENLTILYQNLNARVTTIAPEVIDHNIKIGYQFQRLRLNHNIVNAMYVYQFTRDKCV
jgi:hypothetical protein